MKIATWNVNSLKVRLPHVLDWLAENPVDALCLQETKLTDDKFPQAEIEAAGYHVAFTGQKTYNGVAILARSPITDVVKNNPHFADEQQRLIAGTVDGVRIICAYVVNGQSVDSDKYQYKLAWLDALHDWLQEELAAHPQLAILGDYNIAPEDRDVHDPAAWVGQVLVSPPEREAFARLTALGLQDAFRLFPQADKLFSWWDYRQMAFRRNMGMRIDHILLSPALAKHCNACIIDKLPRKREQPSDHTPVVATLDLPARGSPSFNELDINMAGPIEITNMALFCDFENVALGVRDAKYDKFDIRRVLERLLLKGSIVVKKAYCDWDRYKDFKNAMHEASFELIEIPHVRQSGKNSADIRMVVDALDLCYTKSHVDAFVIISGDSDFSPLVSKLRENNKYVIGIGVKSSTSDLLSANCDEFIFYDDLVREQKAKRRPAVKKTAAKSAPANPVAHPSANPATAPAAAPAANTGTTVPVIAAAAGTGADTTSTEAPKSAGRRQRKDKAEPGAEARAEPKNEGRPEPRADARPEPKPDERGDHAFDNKADDRPDDHGDDHDKLEDRRQEGFDLIVETIEALIAERGEEKMWGSMVKQTMKRRKPGFTESYYGYRSFREMVEDAQKNHLLHIVRDEKPGQYTIRLPQTED